MNNLRRNTLDIVLIATLSAMLTGGKLALSFIPNVEIVTLIIILVTCSLGLRIALPVTLIFTTVEALIYGFNYWMIAYYIYWPLLSVVFYLFNYKGVSKSIYNAILAAIMTIVFGLITTILDAIVAGGLRNDMFIRLFGIFYVRGILFFLAHIISNFIIVLILFKPLMKPLLKFKEKL